MIEIEHVTKIYQLSKKQMQEQRVKDSKKIAVRDVSLTAREGEIFGVLGPNGAGKTTLLRCVATLLTPTEGTIRVNGCAGTALYGIFNE